MALETAKNGLESGRFESGESVDKVGENIVNAGVNPISTICEGKIVLMRHGQTVWNKTGRHTGRTNLALTALGYEQAKSAIPLVKAYSFAKENVFVSPLLRAQETAKTVGFSDFQTVPNLAEWDYGPVEGKTRDELSKVLGHEFDIWSDGVHIDVSGIEAIEEVQNEDGSITKVAQNPGETLDEVVARCELLSRDVSKIILGGQNVMFVAHSQLLRIFTAVWLGQDARFGRSLFLDNASISTLGIVNNAHCLIDWNKTSKALGQN